MPRSVLKAFWLALQVGLIAAGVGLVIAGLAASPLPWLALVAAGAALLFVGLFIDVPEGDA